MSSVVEELVVKTKFEISGQNNLEKANKALEGTKKRASALQTAGKNIRDFFGGMRDGFKQELAAREKHAQGIAKVEKKSRGMMLGIRRAAKVVGRELGDRAGAFQWLSQVWKDLPGWGKLVAILIAAGGAAFALAKHLAEVITKNRKAAFEAGKLNTNSTNQKGILRGIGGLGRIGGEQATEIGNEALGVLREKQVEKLKSGNKSAVNGVSFFDGKGQQRQTPDILANVMVKAMEVLNKPGKGGEAGSEKRLRAFLEPLGLENDNIVQLAKEGKKNPQAFEKMIAGIKSQPVTTQAENEQLAKNQEKVNLFQNNLADLGEAFTNIKTKALMPFLDGVIALTSDLREKALEWGLIKATPAEEAAIAKRKKDELIADAKQADTDLISRGKSPVFEKRVLDGNQNPFVSSFSEDFKPIADFFTGIMDKFKSVGDASPLTNLGNVKGGATDINNNYQFDAMGNITVHGAMTPDQIIDKALEKMKTTLAASLSIGAGNHVYGK